MVEEIGFVSAVEPELGGPDCCLDGSIFSYSVLSARLLLIRRYAQYVRAPSKTIRQALPKDMATISPEKT